MKSILAQEPWRYDSKVIPLPWRQSEADIIKNKIGSGGLALGFYEHDGIVSTPSYLNNPPLTEQVLPHPPILRGIRKVVETMNKAGHTTFPWTPYKHTFAVDLINGIYASDGGADIFSVLKESGEPAIPNFADLINPSLPKSDMNQLWDVQLQKWKFQSEYLEQFRKIEAEMGREIDAIIAPVAPTAAVRHNQFKYYGYASAINLLDYTSVVVPVMFADKSVDGKSAGFEPMSDMDKTVQAECKSSLYVMMIWE